MWIPKWRRDQQVGVDSPVPTQAVSNEEFIPRPQNEQQKQWESLMGEMADEKSKKLGMPRRDFMRSSMGMATAFLASNMIYGPNWDVDAAETLEPSATEEKFPQGEYFVMDVQTRSTAPCPPAAPLPRATPSPSHSRPRSPQGNTSPPSPPVIPSPMSRNSE